MHKAAVIGDRQSVLAFRALGLTVATTQDPQEAAQILHKLAKDNFAIIYITEQLAQGMFADIAKYTDDPDVAIIPIPSKDGTLGIGDKEVHRAVERAVGADILKGD